MELNRMMNRILAALLVALVWSGRPATARACEFCSSLMGINPHYSKSDELLLDMLFQQSDLDGTRFGLNSFSRMALPTGIGANDPPRIFHAGTSTQPTHEERATFELAYRHHFSGNLIATVLLPCSVVNISSGTQHLRVRGVGDPTVMLHYVIADPFSESTPSLLLLGGGVELPLGRHQLRDAEGTVLDPRLQPGSGSVDLVLNALSTIQLSTWTVALDLNGRIATASTDEYRPGSSLSLTSTVCRDLYRSNEDEFAVVGIGGVRQEISGRDRVAGALDQSSGAAATYGNLGGQILYRSFKLDASVLVPLVQSNEAGRAREGLRVLMGVRWML
jgi:hypothetical protein